MDRQRSLQFGEDALRLGRHYGQRSYDGQQSVDVWKLDAAATAECCRSRVRALFSCRRCPLLTPQNILDANISWTIGEGGHRLL